MVRPRFCRNPACPNSRRPSRHWYVAHGSYETRAHGTVPRFRCTTCGRTVSMQTESMHYYAKRRLNLARIFSRVRGGSSLRDIARELGTTRTTVSNAVARLARQAMVAHVQALCGIRYSGKLSFDGLISAVVGRDYPSQITTLGDRKLELLLAMTHCVTERGGKRTEAQQARIDRRREQWRPRAKGLTGSISLLIRELSRFAGPGSVKIDTDEHPLYPRLLAADRTLGHYREFRMLTHRRTPGSAPRTYTNPLFLMNYLDRMIRHRMKEHTRESIALARNATAQMQRMYLFAWDHNTRQPFRVKIVGAPSRLERAGVTPKLLHRLRKEFYTRRHSTRRLPIPESIRMVWLNQLDTPPMRVRKPQLQFGAIVPNYARLDLSFAYPQGP